MADRSFRVVDTGGIVPDDQDLIPSEIFRQARVALEEADAVVMVVDGRTELASPDMELARLLQKTGKPLFLAVNKIDSPKLEAEAENFAGSASRTCSPSRPKTATASPSCWKRCSSGARRKRRRGRWPSRNQHRSPEETAPQKKAKRPLSIAAQGRIRARDEDRHHRSTQRRQINAAERADRNVARHRFADPRHNARRRRRRWSSANGKKYRFIDTAGIRRKGKTKLMAEKLSVVMARKHLEAADVALLVIDATEG